MRPSQGLSRVCVKRTSQVRPPKILSPAAYAACRRECFKSGKLKASCQLGNVQRRIDGIACQRMVAVEGKQWRGWRTHARASHCDSCLGALRESVPSVRSCQVLFHGMESNNSPGSSRSREARENERRPCLSTICMARSHSSNSGARFSPSTLRIYSTS